MPLMKHRRGGKLAHPFSSPILSVMVGGTVKPKCVQGQQGLGGMNAGGDPVTGTCLYNVRLNVPMVVTTQSIVIVTLLR